MIDISYTINGSKVDDSPKIYISKSQSELTSAGNFTINLNNYAGYNANKYGVGDEVRIYARLNGSSWTNEGSPTYYGSGLIFTGIIEDITYEGEGIKETMSLEGRDYSCRLMDRTVEPEVYTNLQPGSIVKDLIFKYTDNISTSGVIIGGSALARIAFNQIPVYDAIKQLADMSQNVFYVNNDRDLHFEPPGSISSGYTFNNTNVLEGDFKQQRDTCFNQVWVYGDRYLDGYKETFTAGSPVGGSIFNLIYKPSNTQITVSGGLVQPGGIYNMNLYSIESGLKYLVDYDDARIIFVSGTNNGVNIPSSGNQVIIDYKRSLPIVKVGDNNSSQATYGKRVKVIVDKNIKDPQTAEAIMLSNLDQLSEPQVEGNILIEGVADLTPGQTCLVDFPREGVDNQTYTIVEANYHITPEEAIHDHIVKAKVSKKLPDLTDKIKQMMLDIKKLQGNDIADTDLITRYQSATGSYAVRQSGCYVYSRSIAGEGLIWGNSAFGVWGTQKWKDHGATSMIYNSPEFGKYNTAFYGGSGGNGFILGNNQFGILGANSLGEALGQWTLIWSGCYMV